LELKSYFENYDRYQFNCSLCFTFRVIENVNGHTKFHNHYNCINLKLSGNCKTWRSDDKSEGDGWLSVDVFVDSVEEKWHANLKTDHLFVPVRYIYSNLEFQYFVIFLNFN